MNKTIGISKRDVYQYPSKNYNFRPSKAYPEYPFEEAKISPEENETYEMVRDAFFLQGLDKENYGSNNWNPLGQYVSPGNKVVIKPNMVMDFNPTGDGTDCLYTHPSVVAAVVDYVVIALRGRGEIIVGDAPMQECNFEKLIEDSGYKQLIEYYRNEFENSKIEISLKDFRGYTSRFINGVHYGDENANTARGILVELGENSAFSNYSVEQLERLRINSYDPSILKTHHNSSKHEYLVNGDILSADVIINMPKPKTHRKAGVTIALKNLVGINVRKEYLPHHLNGSSRDGGDEYNNANVFKSIKSRLQDDINIAEHQKKFKKAKLLIFLRKVMTSFIRFSADQSWDGSWYGNETISKTIGDLNSIIFFCDKKGKLRDEKQRNYFIVADMIVSGENEGPIEPTRKEAGLIAVGEDPVCFDEVIATIMGFDIKKIPTLCQMRQNQRKMMITECDSQAIIVSNYSNWNNKKINELSREELMGFIPAVGWRNHIEMNDR